MDLCDSVEMELAYIVGMYRKYSSVTVEQHAT